jgi:hypothetical protein
MVYTTDAFLLRLWKLAGSDSTTLGACSLGLIAAPFTPVRGLTIASVTEANYGGYARKSLGNSTVTFTSSDGNDYIEWPSQAFTPTGSATPNTIYGWFLIGGSDSVTVTAAEVLPGPVALTGTTTTLTIIPRMGQSPTIAWGSGVIGS